MAAKGKTSARGYGHRHQVRRRQLLHNHVDGTPCWWCGRPMFRDAASNWDERPLSADHEQSIRDSGTKGLANRLLHERCNKQRQAGDRDDQRPALKLTPSEKPAPKKFEW